MRICSRKWPALIAALLLLVPTAACRSAEDLPRDNQLASKAEDVLEEYIKEVSRPTLKYFDELTKARNPNRLAQKTWVEDTKEVAKELVEAWRTAEEIQKKERGVPMNDAMKKWYAQEKENWTNVHQIGQEMMGIHDDLVYYENEIEKVHLKKIEQDQREATLKARKIKEGMSKGVQLLDNLQLVNLPLLSMIAQALQQLDEIVDEVNPIVISLEATLVRQEKEIKEFAGKIARSNYKDNLSKLASKKIDVDQSGVFYTHERVWESNLKDQLSRFETMYGKYKLAAMTFLDHNIHAVLTGGSAKLQKWFKFNKSLPYERFDETLTGGMDEIGDEMKEIQTRAKTDEAK
jgi:hypothetical protein